MAVGASFSLIMAKRSLAISANYPPSMISPVPAVQPPRFAQFEYFSFRNGFQMAADERARVLLHPAGV